MTFPSVSALVSTGWFEKGSYVDDFNLLSSAKDAAPSRQSAPRAKKAKNAFAPRAEQIFDPRAERDACGIGFVAHSDGQQRHNIVRMALDGLCGVKHRGPGF